MTTPTLATTVNDAMSMAELRKMAKAKGLTVTRGVTRVQLAEILAAKTPATAPARKNAKSSTKLIPRTDAQIAADHAAVSGIAPAKGNGKTSPVRTDVNPADVKPAAHTVEESAEITQLEGFAHKFIASGEHAAMELADVIVRLYPLAPWRGKKLRNGHPMTLAAYYSTVIGVNKDTGFPLPTKARQVVVKAMGNTVEVQVIADMTGSGPRSIARDRVALGLANEARTAGGKASKPAAAPKTADTTKAPATAPAMVPVLSVTDVAAFIGDLDDTDALTELAATIAARLAELSA